jgi:uncharacterized protein YecE (DUF72 family)
MADHRTDSAAGATGDLDSSVDSGNYEVVRRRLVQAGTRLLDRTNALNDQRKQLFGGAELTVTANERIRTENNCIPRDIVSIGNLLLVGYNVFIGLKSETTISDVFALHRFESTANGYDCSAVPLDSAGGFLLNSDFQKQFANLFKYYRDARLLQLLKTDTALLAVFQSGATHLDVKVFRWRIGADGRLVYLDDRGERDYQFPPAFDFEWIPLTREDQVKGRLPHYNVADELFVNNLGGTLTLKIEDNTEAGTGIYEERVDDINQGLDDGQFSYAALGSLILLKVLPFRESSWRHLVYNRRTRAVARIDAIAQACHQLPEDHGIIFPGGYYLQTGAWQSFAGDIADLLFHRAIRSPNGEDVLYVYHRRRDGHYVLLPYNLIDKAAQTPIHCHGYTIFADGRLVVFRALSEEPTRVHPMQVWSTPFVSAEHAAAAPTDNSFLAKVGNADLVRGISEALSITRAVANDDPDRQTYEDIVAGANRATSAYYWLGHPEVGDLKSALAEVSSAAELIIDEFEKVIALREQASQAVAQARRDLGALAQDLNSERWHDLSRFTAALSSLRTQRGHLISLRDVRYIDLAQVDQLESQVIDHFDRVSRDCVAFLVRHEAFTPLVAELDRALDRLPAVRNVADVMPLIEQVKQAAAGLDLLNEVVANLQIDDATRRTAILENIADVFARVNRSRAAIEARHAQLNRHELTAEFAAQFKVLGQSVASALNLCDSPERCDEQQSRIIVQLQELETRFGEVDDFLADLAGKRDEIYEAFSARKQTLIDERQRRVQNILAAADRIVDGVTRRASGLGSADELHAYFAADAMVLKLRSLADQLQSLGDTVKADEIDARLKAARQDALRGMRDRTELFEDGTAVIKLGKHRFRVNQQPLQATLVSRDDGIALHLTGTDFFEPVTDEQFLRTRDYWMQDLISETAEVYRAEYLAACMLDDAESGRAGLTVEQLHVDNVGAEQLLQYVRQYAQTRYDEGYERGVHDADAARILEKLLAMRDTAGRLRYPSAARALAVLYWMWLDDIRQRRHLALQAVNVGRLRRVYGTDDAGAEVANELAPAIAGLVTTEQLPGFTADAAATAARYLVEELTNPHPRFVASGAALRLRDELERELTESALRSEFEDDLRALRASPRQQLALVRAWVAAAARSKPELAHVASETCALIIGRELEWEPSSALVEFTVDGLLGRHGRIRDRQLTLRYDEFLARLEQFRSRRVPGYRDYRRRRDQLLERERARLRLDEFVPRVMSAFVRNRLINEVYLPLIGDNLAKQIGAAGDGKRTDLMGMLLLISPPGYGKTTLMEYVASRLGFAFVKVNGPSLGHAVRSLDPTEAPNATARQEVEKINLALEMGNNVMLYLDDIQHTHPELLQKFISLCDAQRRIEGVWAGRTRTYDLRGKKLCVVMAGNPYTESGDKFQIPDMLSNRADVYNLGDILQGADDLFRMSYVENCLTSNPVLAPLAAREQSDVYLLIRMAQGEPIATTKLKHGYSQVELEEVLAVLRRILCCQEVLLKVNQAYILSAAQDDAFRTEPPFKLQGSYRNMAKLAEKVVSAMTDDEVETLIDDHYLGEAQTLTTEAEQNLLKLAELRGRTTASQAQRWADIKAEFVRQTRMGGSGDDPVSRITGTLSGLSADLSGIRDVLAQGRSDSLRQGLDAVADHLQGISTAVADAARAGQAAPLPVTVEVQNQAPPGLAELLSQQVAIVERTLVPMVQAATRDLQDSQTISQQLVQVIELLETVDLRLREATAVPPRASK